MEPIILSVREAAGILGWTEKKLRTMISRGGGPPVRRTSEKRIIILRKDLTDWLEGLEIVNRKQKV